MRLAVEICVWEIQTKHYYIWFLMKNDKKEKKRKGKEKEYHL